MNLNLAIDTSNFKPYDWSLPMLIVHDYRDTYRRYQDMMDKIAEEDGLYILPDTPENELYRATMEKYNADREAAMESFSRGMNIENARLLNNIRRRHFSEITPINKAIEAYNKDIDKIASLGPNVTVANRNNRKISDYYGGVNPGIDYRDNKTIQATAAGVVQGINNALMSAPQQAGTIAGQYFELKQKGIDGKDALNAILNLNPNLRTEQGASDINQLMLALNKVYDEYSFAEGTPENEKIWREVVTGAIQGIQAPKYELLTDRSYRNPHLIVMDQYNEEEAALDNIIKEGRANDLGLFKDENGNWKYDEKKYEKRLKLKAKKELIQSQADIYNMEGTVKVTIGPRGSYGGQFYGDEEDEDELKEPANWTVVDSNNRPVSNPDIKKAIVEEMVKKRRKNPNLISNVSVETDEEEEEDVTPETFNTGNFGNQGGRGRSGGLGGIPIKKSK